MKEIQAETNSLVKHGSFITLLGLSLVVTILYVAKMVVMPIAVAVMLTFLLAPLVIRFQRVGLPRVVAIISTVIIAFSVITAIFWMISIQVISLAEQLPGYEQTIRTKVRQINNPEPTPSPLSRAGDVVENLRKELNNEATEISESGEQDASTIARAPIPVEIKPAKMNFFESTSQVFGPFVSPLGTTALIAIFVIAILFQREDLRERFIRISSGGRLNIATEALDEAAKRVSRYLMMQLVVNAAYGIPIGIGLYFIGVPNAMLWGFLATLLRFIPYLGPWLAAAFPLALAFAIDPGWSKFFLALSLFLSLEIVSNNIIEPWLYGVSTGTSNFALMVAAVFWTWLWGPVGLFLSTPLTVCMVVLGNYVPSLNFISVLLGSVPALKPHERLYQRMLAMDYDEMLFLSQSFLKENTTHEYFDQLLLPALSLAEVDRHKGGLADIRHSFILQNTPELLEDLFDKDDIEIEDTDTRKRVLIVPAKDEMDELSAVILTKIFALNNISSSIYYGDSIVRSYAELGEYERPDLVCISALPPRAFMPARRLGRSLNKMKSAPTCMLGIWNYEVDATDLQNRLPENGKIVVVTSVDICVNEVQALTGIRKPTEQTEEISGLASAAPEA
ncbi:AI-2E family transporter [Alteromonas lipotrueiana]|uniref:AI-2E family transporter n=1 Tax=Alteromonas lipotrueiana TaxID=2803815 RepID=UPI001C487478|nr:AI-2E family transporter [Alteromonas lipotrueiana]